MNLKIKKTIADLLIKPGRSLLVIFALTIGLWGVGTILVSFKILSNDLNENFLNTKPAHVILTSKNFNKFDLGKFRKEKQIQSAEFRDYSMERIEVFPNEWLPLWLYGVQDFKNFKLASITPQAGKSIPDPGSMLVERNGLLISNLKLGSSPRIQAKLKTTRMKVSGITFDAAQEPATQDAFIHAYVSKKTFQNITGQKLNHRLILRFKDVSSKKEVQVQTEKIITEFGRNAIKIDSIKIPNFEEHPHQWQLNTLMYMEGIIGFLAFILGMVLVSQLMNSILAQQIRQIGIMKAIGATSLDILKIYLSMVFIFAIISTIIAIPLAVISGFAYSQFVAKVLNFDILTTSLPTGFYMIFTTIAIFLPLLLALPSLIRGIKVSTLEALNDFGTTKVTEKAKSILPKNKHISLNIRLAFRSLVKRKKRMVITIMTMALGVAIFSTGFNVRASLANFLFDSANSMKYDIRVVLKNQVTLEQALKPFKDIKKIKSIESWNGGTGRLQSNIISTKSGIGIVALPFNTTLRKWDVIKGTWLTDSKEMEFVLNQKGTQYFDNVKVGKRYNITIGDKVTHAKLVGIIKEFNLAKIYIDREKFDSLVNPKHLVNSLMISTKNRDYKAVLKLKKEIERELAKSNLQVLFVMSQAQRALTIFNHLEIILSLLIFLSLLVLVVSALGMASAMGINILERTREIGILRAIGATPKMIFKIFVTEGMLVSFVSILLGLILALPLSYYAAIFFGDLILGEETPLNFALSSQGFIVTFLVTFFFGWLASRVPARTAVSLSTREALSYE